MAVGQGDKQHLATKEIGAGNNVTKAVTVAPRRGHSAGQRLHDASEDNAEEPGPETERSRDTHRKRRRMPTFSCKLLTLIFLPTGHAPVIVTENEDLERDAGGNGDEEIDNGTKLTMCITQALTTVHTDAGTPPRHRKKWKQTPESGLDESMVEADDFSTGPILPQIQNLSYKVDNRQGRMTPSNSSPVLDHSPESLGPLSPCSITNEGQDAKHQKPTLSRTAKALQTAIAEVGRLTSQTK